MSVDEQNCSIILCLVQELEHLSLQIKKIAREQDLQREALDKLGVSHLQATGMSSLANDVADLKARLNGRSLESHRKKLPVEKNDSHNQDEALPTQQQDIITRLTRVEAALAEGGVRKDLSEAEALEPTNKDATDLTTRKRALATIENQRTYTFDRSVYDAVFFAFAEHMHGITSFLAIISFLVNMTMQVGVILVLIKKFTVDPFEEPYLESLKHWRQSEGQSYRNADSMTGVSLTARVCAEDSGLHLSGGQVDIVGAARDYLDGNDGVILCTIAILLWNLTCACDLRRSIQFVMALLNIQMTAGHMEIFADSNGLYILNLSFGRMLIGFSVAVCRSAVAILLLIYGSWWLAYTTSISDLLLNASALGFALDIDEIVFAVLSPAPRIGIIDSMQPLMLPKRVSVFLVPFVLAVGIAATVILVEVNMAEYIRTCLELSLDILCSDSTDTDFIIATSQAGWMVYAKTVPWAEATTDLVQARRMVTQRLINKSPELGLAQQVERGDRSQNLLEVSEHAGMSLEESVNNGASCVDQVDNLGEWLYIIAGEKTMRSVASCLEVAEFCRGNDTSLEQGLSLRARTVRMLCPITCGCADPLSGLWHLAQAMAGCPWKQCQPRLAEVTKQTNVANRCEDTPLSQLQMNSNWTFMLVQMRQTNMINESIFYNLSRIGCPAFQALQYEQRQVLCGTIDLWGENVGNDIFFGAGFMCSESCACIYPYNEGPVVGVDEQRYIPGNPGLCPRPQCWAKYMGYARDHCKANGKQVAETQTPDGSDLTCVA